jgi:hypothetical protein
MLEYEALKPLFKFLQMLKNNKKQESDNFGWTMVKFMHQEILKVIKATMKVVHYVVFSCDEFFTMDNQSWLFMHLYVMQNWVRILILISLNQVVEGLGSDNLTKIIKKVLMIARYNKRCPYMLSDFIGF